MSLPKALTRLALHEAVWSTPRAQLAARWEMTTVQLTQLCRMYTIPLPRAGYWTPVACGKAPDRPVLPGDGALLVVAPTTSSAPPVTAPISEASMPAPVKKRKKRPMRVETLADALPLIRRAHRSYASPKCPRDDRHRYLVPTVTDIPIVKVFPETLTRALLLLDQLLRAFKVRQWGLRIGTGEDDRRTHNWVQIGEREVAFIIREHLTPIQIESPYLGREFERSYTGAGWLKLRIGHRWYAEFREGKRLRLEDQVPEILARFELEVEQKVTAEDAERRRIALEDQRYQLRGLVREAVKQQQGCEEQLAALLGRHRHAEQLRTFLREAQVAFAATGVITAKQFDWLGWVARKVTQVDPLHQPSEINLACPCDVMASIRKLQYAHGERYAFLEGLDLAVEVDDALYRLSMERMAKRALRAPRSIDILEPMEGPMSM